MINLSVIQIDAAADILNELSLEKKSKQIVDDYIQANHAVISKLDPRTSHTRIKNIYLFEQLKQLHDKSKKPFVLKEVILKVAETSTASQEELAYLNTVQAEDLKSLFLKLKNQDLKNAVSACLNLKLKNGIKALEMIASKDVFCELKLRKYGIKPERDNN